MTRAEVRVGTDGRWGGTCTGRAPTKGWAQARLRGAHLKHAVHGCDAGGVYAQRLIERLRVLPSRRERAYIRRGPRYGSAQTGGYGAAAAQAAYTRSGPRLKVG